MSVGLAASPEHADDAEGLLASADRALYEAKRCGRNRVAVAAAGPEAAAAAVKAGPFDAIERDAMVDLATSTSAA